MAVCLALLVLAGGTAFGYKMIGPAAPTTWYAMGHLNFYYSMSSSEELDGANQLSVCIGPRVLYYPIPGLGVGADLNYDADFNEYSSGTFAVGPRAAYFFMKTEQCTTKAGDIYEKAPCGWLMPFVGTTFQYVTRCYDYGGSMTQQNNGWRLRVGGGLSPVLGKKATLPVELGFETEQITYGDPEYEYTSTSNRLYLEIGFGAYVWKKPDK
jgi:hypothetical protein